MFKLYILLPFFFYLSPYAFSCPTGGKIGPDNKCYISYNQTDKTWVPPQFQSYCKNQGGFEASVHSAILNNFLWGFAKDPAISNVWIGLHCDPQKNSAKYLWLDGTTYDYNNFNTGSFGYPGKDCSTFGGEVCVYLKSADGTWDVDDCGTGDGAFSTICNIG